MTDNGETPHDQQWTWGEHEWVPRRTTEYACPDGDLYRQWAELNEQFGRASHDDAVHNREPQAPKVAERIQEVERQIMEARKPFTFEAMGRVEWTNLVAAHPPTDEQLQAFEGYDTKPDCNLDTLAPAAMAACCINPAGFDEAAATQVWNEWPKPEAERLWAAVRDLHQSGSDGVPFNSNASAALRASERRRERRSDSSSHDPSSSEDDSGHQSVSNESLTG